MKYLLLLSISCFLVSCAQNTQPVKSVGNQDRSSPAVLESIRKNDPSVIADVSNNLGYYNPEMIAAAGSSIYVTNPKQGLYMYYLAELRANSDADKLKDAATIKASLRRRLVLQSVYGSMTRRSLTKDTASHKKAINKAVAADKRIPRYYDPRWIASPVGEAIKKDVSLKPRGDWAKIDSESRELYIKRHEQSERAMEGFKSMMLKGRTSNDSMKALRKLGQGHPFN